VGDKLGAPRDGETLHTLYELIEQVAKKKGLPVPEQPAP
jgi:hypothetical protein